MARSGHGRRIYQAPATTEDINRWDAVAAERMSTEARCTKCGREGKAYEMGQRTGRCYQCRNGVAR